MEPAKIETKPIDEKPSVEEITETTEEKTTETIEPSEEKIMEEPSVEEKITEQIEKPKVETTKPLMMKTKYKILKDMNGKIIGKLLQ